MKITILKIAVVVTNVLLLIWGVIIFALGIWVLAVDHGIANLAKIKENGVYSRTLDQPGLLESAAVICIVVGVVMFILSIITFCGVRKESKCFMATCSALLAALILLDVIVIILTSLSNQRTEKHLHGALMDGVVNQYDSLIESRLKFSVYFDRAQVELDCCGVVSYTDFREKSVTWKEKTEFMIPRTCCFMNSKSSYLHSKQYDLVNVTCPRNLVSSHLQPCYSPIKDWLTQKTTVLMAVSAVIAGLKIRVYGAMSKLIDWLVPPLWELIVIIMNIILFRTLKEDTPYNDM